jgi:hypothetical protein
LAGFTCGEGSFYVSIYERKSKKTGYAVIVGFSIAQHYRDIELMKKKNSRFIGLWKF